MQQTHIHMHVILVLTDILMEQYYNRDKNLVNL